MNVLALDLSLTATGVADHTGTRTITTTLKGAARLDYLGRTILDLAIGEFASVAGLSFVRPDLVAIEGPSYASANQAHNLGMLGGVVRRDLFVAGVRTIDVAPATIKIFGTGKGNASKNEMLVAAVKRFGYQGTSGDEADALILWALVKGALGKPVVEVPKTHGRAVATVRALLDAKEVG